MRSSGSSVQLELAEDSVAVMRRAVSLALRWGHAQVTTLHVASAVLSDAGGGLLRAACLLSRASSHPLQCQAALALELCMSVALSSLATVVPRPDMFGHRAPSLSNALAAAFKRAQANQRRGGSASASAAEVRHVAAAKVELKQVVISILDDPSVSRVMREAGLSSAEVKANVEKAISSDTATSSTASPNTQNPMVSQAMTAEAERVLDYMASGTNRCVVVLGESAAAAEAVVKAAMDKVSNGELRRQHERLNNAQLVPFSAVSFQRMPREVVEASAGDLCAFVRECCAAGKGVVLVLEDLGYAAEAWTAASWKRQSDDHRAHCRLDYYCPVEHAVLELSSLVRGKDDMFWLLGFGAYASYPTSCRSGQPSLETVLELHPIVVPDDGSLALSHRGDSDITHSGTDRVVATAASVPSWIRRCHGPVLAGSELTLSLYSPAASSSHQLSLANPNSGYSDSLSKPNLLDGATTVRRRRPKFTELTAENLKILCSTLETRIPRHRDIAPGIASAVLRRRSGVTRTTRPTSAATWLLFHGRDNDGKMAMARELARLVFGSYAELTCIACWQRLSPGTGNDEHGGGCMQMFYEAIRENPHRVVLIDGVEHDSKLEAAIMDAMASGTARGCYGGVVSLEDSIVVCSEVVFESASRSPARASSPRPVKQRIMSDDVDGKVEDDGAERGRRQVVPHYFSLDLNACAIDVKGEDEGSSWHHAVEILTAVDGVFFFEY